MFPDDPHPLTVFTPPQNEQPYGRLNLHLQRGMFLKASAIGRR